ncbi:MAG: hypothetical protein ACI4LB_06535 [Candidatus Fimenecus sp.]
MRVFYLIVKYSTIIGTFLQAFFEHLTCRVYEVLIEDGRYLRTNEMCGHIEHEIIRKRSVSFGVCFFPFLFNLLLGLITVSVGAVNIYYFGEFFTNSGMVHIANFLFLWMGISCLTNLFPQWEDALTLKEQIYGKGKSNLFVKIIVAPIFGILYGGAFLQRYGITLFTSIAFSFAVPYILGAFVPTLYNALI